MAGLDIQELIYQRDRVTRMMSDPDLTGHALLFALALDVMLAKCRSRGHTHVADNWMTELQDMAWLRRPDTPDWWVRHVIGDDAPRYEPEHVFAVTCVAPMIRRDGLCGKGTSDRFIDRDPLTGAAEWKGLCSRHSGLRPTFNARTEAWVNHGRPSPPANRGGVFPRYFSGNWTELYRWAAPGREPTGAGPPPTPPRPRLRIVRDIDEER